MTKGIREKDILDFEKYARKLDEVINRIREYKPEAHVYVTPGEINLMCGESREYHVRNERAILDPVVTSVLVTGFECGDW